MTITTAKDWFEREFSGREFVEVVAKYAPALTPIAPAAVAVAGMTQGLSAAYSGWAFLPALGSGLGMEGTGYLSSYLLIRAIRRGDWLSAFFALVFLGGYAAFAILAMATMQNAATFQFFVAMSVVTYLCVGLYTYDNKREQAAAEAQRRRIEAKKDEIELERLESELQTQREKAAAEIAIMREQAEVAKLNAERLLQNAQNRGAAVFGRSSRKDEQPNTRLNPERLEAVRAFLKGNPEASVREVCEGCNISSTDTASRYMKAAK